IAAAETRSGTRPSVSDNSEICCRLGRKRRFVLLLAWLTLCPTWTPLPVIMHLRAMPYLDLRRPRHRPPRTVRAVIYAAPRESVKRRGHRSDEQGWVGVARASRRRRSLSSGGARRGPGGGSLSMTCCSP